MKESFLKNILVNIRAFATINIRKENNNNAKRITELEKIAANAEYNFKQRFLFHSLISYFSANPEIAKPYQKEIEYTNNFGNINVFPYPSRIGETPVEAGYDTEKELPYVMHNHNKVYFPSFYSIEDAIYKYQYLIYDERLLGIGDDYAPHQYQSSKIQVKKGDVLFDIGAAEGLFALNLIDKVSHTIIVESDENWIRPLKHTFEPYREKVDIIQKFISSSDTEKTMSLSSLISKYDCTSLFIKMDIEGNELPTIASAKDTLMKHKEIKMSIASYHKQHDYEELKTIFEQLGYNTETSKGYMFFQMYDMPIPPYFRHGIIRAMKK